jgi:intracellular sulfur oxidation DsrE/DsrF family protein
MNSDKIKFMNRLFLLIAFALISFNINAQSEKHRIVFDLSDEDTSSHSTVLRQFTNILKVVPDAELELVCHGKAVNMFVKDKLYFEEKMKDLKSKAKVSFKVCANSLRRFNIDQSLVSPLAEIVPVAMLELSSKQKEGWSYIKAGH